MDLRILSKAKDEASAVHLGQYEGTVETPTELSKQVAYNKSMTETPMSREPEVMDTETKVHVPNLKIRQVNPGPSYDDATEFYKINHVTRTVRRRPNRWQTLCNLSIPADTIITGWNPKIDLDTVFIENQSSSAGVLYVAPTIADLQGSTIRGKSIAAGATFTLETEAGGFLYAPAGAIADIILLWFEDDDGKPV